MLQDTLNLFIADLRVHLAMVASTQVVQLLVIMPILSTGVALGWLLYVMYAALRGDFDD